VGASVYDGDSITVGSFATPYPDFLSAFAGGWKSYNVAGTGRTTAQILSAFSTSVTPLATSGLNIVTVLGGTDDCIQGDSASTAWSNLASIAAAAHSAGFKAIVMTLPSLNGYNTCRDALNTLIYANWSGTFDALADIAGNANLGADGAYSNATYFNADGIHPTTLSEQTIMAPLEQTQINALISAHYGGAGH
jgi:lysophospholipase L1-like esterase